MSLPSWVVVSINAIRLSMAIVLGMPFVLVLPRAGRIFVRVPYGSDQRVALHIMSNMRAATGGAGSIWGGGLEPSVAGDNLLISG
jgi:hypothetical protein